MAVSIQDQSQTAANSSGYFEPKFGSISVPKDNVGTAVVIGVFALVGLVIWKKVK